MKRIKEFFVKLFGCKTPKEVVVKEHVCVEDVKEVVKEDVKEVVKEIVPEVKKPKRKYHAKPKATAVKK